MITVMGLGFVGLTTALGFADKGFKVFGYEISRERIDALAGGRVPFHEPMLPEKLAEHLNTNFILVSDLAEAVNQSQVVMLCVGTPSQDDGKVDLGPLKVAIDSILDVSDDTFRVLCVKSTVPPSTTGDIVQAFIRAKGKELGKDVGVANNPEFLREGFAWDDFVHPDRVVVGTSDEKSWEIMHSIYEPFGVKLHNVSLNTGEFIKYLSNTLLATMISFANELSMIGYAIEDVDIKQAFKILHEDKRWFGSPARMVTYVYPGCGFGGYCLPKDTSALIGKAQDFGFDARILRSVLDVNVLVRSVLTDQIAMEIGPRDRIALLGLAFKPESDDVRMTPAVWMLDELLKRGMTNIIAYDPLATDGFRKLYDYDIDYAESMEQAVAEAKAAVLVTAWREFAEKKALLNGIKVFDLRYFL